MSSAITIENLREVFGKNKFQSECVPHIQIEQHVTDTDNDVRESEGWIRRPLGPGGPMAIVLRYKNYLFRSGSLPLQKSLLREAITDAQNTAPSILKGRKWPVRRVAEGLTTCLSNKVPEDAPFGCAWNELCFATICEMEHIQIMVIDAEAKTIRFSPDDIRVWKRDVPIYAMSNDGRWLFCEDSESETWCARSLGLWFSKMVDSGWKISWPIAEGTMESLRDIIENAGLAVEGRIKKDELARKAGHTAAIALLGSWSRSEITLE
jgi:hypothetical protein